MHSLGLFVAVFPKHRVFASPKVVVGQTQLSLANHRELATLQLRENILPKHRAKMVCTVFLQMQEKL